MTGKREAICARLLALGEGLHDWTTRARNVANLSSLDSLPAYVVWDGDQGRDEAAAASINPNSPARRLGPKILVMTPTIVVTVAGPEATVGATANALHDLVVGTILNDAALAALILHDRLDWLGSDYRISAEAGETVIEYAIALSLTYGLQAADLVPAETD